MDNKNANEETKEEVKDTRNNLFTPNDGENGGQRQSRLDALSDSKEDDEAVPADKDDKTDNVYQDLRNSKNNGYMKEGDETEGSKVDDEEISKLNLEEELKNSNSNTDRRPSAQHGASGMPVDAGTFLHSNK